MSEMILRVVKWVLDLIPLGWSHVTSEVYSSHMPIVNSSRDSDGFCSRCTNSNLALVGGLVGGLGGGPAGAAAGQSNIIARRKFGAA